MFKKILIANRGEIAVRIVRTCREMGITAVAMYEAADQQSLHVRLADECVELVSDEGFLDGAAIIELAQRCGADAIHPGYGFLAEDVGFIRACQMAGLAFIGPPVEVVQGVRDKLAALSTVRAAGFATVMSSPISFGVDDLAALRAAAGELEYPLVIKSCNGGRGPGERLARSPQQLLRAMQRAQAESRVVFGSQEVYLERAILPAHQVAVQVLGDGQGNLVHLGDREGSLVLGNRKVVEETPSPSLTPEQRHVLCETAVAIARLFNYQNAGTVEFLVDEAGQFYFTEIKARIQVEHPLTELVTRLDLVREQIRIAAGEPLGWTQQDVQPQGWAMLCRINAEDPWNHFLPSPGQVDMLRLPGGPEIRVDTYVYCGCRVPDTYDPLLAKLSVWGADRQLCLQRMQRALEGLKLTGLATNLPVLQRVFTSSAFIKGAYTTDLLRQPLGEFVDLQEHLRDLAAIAAILYLRRNAPESPTVSPRTQSGWHRASRRLAS
ncbi:MAG: acetyl-CoA carboxylase biotin carboxylase subunit [Anaerolineales bacterium]|nr:acetyl-CoA carboxylase biotin carboxylase subunit [Anaerolineales bacterium]